MNNRKILVLILLLIGAVFLCGCDLNLQFPALMTSCKFVNDPVKGDWFCTMVITNPSGEGKFVQFYTNYCDPYKTTTSELTCTGKEYAPPSPSPSPSPSPTPGGPTYKITDSSHLSQGGGGGGGGETPGG